MEKETYTYLLEIQKRLERVFPFPGWGKVKKIDDATFEEHNFFVADTVSMEMKKEFGSLTAYFYGRQYANTPNMPFKHWYCHVIVFYEKEYITDNLLWLIQRTLRHWGRTQVKRDEDHSIVGVIVTETGFSPSAIEIISRAFYVETINQGIMGQYLVGVNTKKKVIYTPQYGVAPKLGKHAELGLKSFFNPIGII